jgi:hypothetical protein
MIDWGLQPARMLSLVLLSNWSLSLLGWFSLFDVFNFRGDRCEDWSVLCWILDGRNFDKLAILVPTNYS